MSRALGLAAAALLVVATLACGCGRRDDSRPVDVALVAWLSKARSVHHLADLAEDENDLAGALASLDRLATGELPPGGPTAPEVDEVLADTLARVAELRARLGAFDEAERALVSGLEHAREPSYFRGHLLEVRGLLHERRAKALAATGDATGAERERAAAAQASLEAIAIQEQVIRRATADAGRR